MEEMSFGSRDSSLLRVGNVRVGCGYMALAKMMGLGLRGGSVRGVTWGMQRCFHVSVGFGWGEVW